MRNDNKWIEPLIGLGILAIAGGFAFSFGSKNKFRITNVSDCSSELMDFDKVITISTEKESLLKRAYETISNKLKIYFTNIGYPIPDFYIQGSHAMKTSIENRKLISDVDLAIIFPIDPGVTYERLQYHVKEALRRHTRRGVYCRQFCVRLNYTLDFHVDLPIYLRDDETRKILFGSRGDNWEHSDPRSFVKWFETKTRNESQLIRVIRYLKAWAENTKEKNRHKFPSGLALTLWAIEFYKKEIRDDIALFSTCSNILKYLNDNFKSQWTAKMPVEPFDDAFNRLTKSQKSVFYDSLKDMVVLMSEAVSSDKKSKSVSRWKRIFGRKFGDSC